MIDFSKFKYIIGIDECGTGAFAGPIYVCAVKSLINWTFPNLNDSKKIAEKKRFHISNELKHQKNINYNIVSCTSEHLDNNGFSNSLISLYKKSLDNLICQDSIIILDGLYKIPNINHYSIPKADQKYKQVMAASILAKTTRDQLMIDLSKTYPQYEFDKNKGYNSENHKKAIKEYGFCSIHRKSFNIKIPI